MKKVRRERGLKAVRVNLSIPYVLHNKMLRLIPGMNWSRIATKAFEHEVGLRSKALQPKETE